MFSRIPAPDPNILASDSLTASDALLAFSTREISPVELMEKVICRSEEVGPGASGFMATFFEQALEAAKVSEARWLGIGGPPRPLEGLPVALSDDLEVEGQQLTESTVQLLDHKVGTTGPMA